MSWFAGKIVWVTGASGALGGQVASDLAAAGATVIGASRKGPPDFQIRDGIYWLGTDVTSDASVRGAFGKILARFGRIDGLVASTNLPVFGDLLDLSDDDWRTVIEVKLLGSLRPVRAVAPQMEKQGHGAIVLVTGTGRGTAPSLQHLPGAGMNATLNFLVPALAARFGAKGIRVNAVAPGPIRSPRHDLMKTIGSGGAPIKLNTQGVPRDIADSVLHLLSDKARFTTGITVTVDGGGRL